VPLGLPTSNDAAMIPDRWSSQPRRCIAPSAAMIAMAVTFAYPRTALSQWTTTTVCPGESAHDSPLEEATKQNRLHLRTAAAVLVFAAGDKPGDSAVVSGGQIDARDYMGGGLALGGTVLLGGASTNNGGNNTPVRFATLVQPLVGWHFTSVALRETRGAPGSYIDGATRCDRSTTSHVYTTHVLAVQPLFFWGGRRDELYYPAVYGGTPENQFSNRFREAVGGGHVVWEWDYFQRVIAARDELTQEPHTVAGQRWRSALGVGYVHGLGYGGNWVGTAEWGFFSFSLGGGLYYLKSAAGFASMAVGLSILPW
jgi:hypothetical protein